MGQKDCQHRIYMPQCFLTHPHILFYLSLPLCPTCSRETEIVMLLVFLQTAKEASPLLLAEQTQFVEHVNKNRHTSVYLFLSVCSHESYANECVLWSACRWNN